jgi:pimeloyl-ACP methyl ester carboxylesterase
LRVQTLNRSNRLPLLTVMLVLAWLLAACAAGTGTPAPGSQPGITLQPCELSGPGGVASGQRAECGSLSVYEDRQSGTGRQIELNIAVIPAVSRNPQPDPLFVLVGGPGEAATQSYSILASAFERINQRRDIVLVDQRGTGESHPLECQAAEEDEAALETDTEAVQAIVRRCLEELEADPRFYTTSIAMDDLEDVRQGLGYEQINLYGVSYGTRAALVYMRQHPQSVRAAILDGLAPPDWVIGPRAPADAQRAVDQILQRCQSDPACNEAFPDLRISFERILADLRDEPVELSLLHPVSGERTDFTLTYEFLTTTVHGMTYSPETAALLPLMIHTAARQDDYSNLTAFGITYIHSTSGAINPGMRFSVICAEDVPLYEQEGLSEGYLGEYLVESFRDICTVWPQGQIPDGFHDPVSSQAPVLLLSGEADPITPPANAELAAQHLPNSLHLVAPGQGHANIFRGCIPTIAADFIESGSVQGLETECVQDLEPLPFFLNFSGPTP